MIKQIRFVKERDELLGANRLYKLGKSNNLPYPLVSLEDVIENGQWKPEECDPPRIELIPVEDILGSFRMYINNYYDQKTDLLGFERWGEVVQLLNKDLVFNTNIEVALLNDGHETKYFIAGDGNHRLWAVRKFKAKYINAEIKEIYTTKKRYNFKQYYNKKEETSLLSLSLS